MGDYEKRMLDEYNDLVEKVDKLYVFTKSDTFKELEKDEKYDLSAQYIAMKDYEDHLLKRLKRRGLMDD
jgi:hypothetical protein